MTPGLPDWWAAVAGDGPRCLRPAWLSYEPDRLPGPLHTFALIRDGRPVVASVGARLTEASPRRFADPLLVLRDGVPGESGPPAPWQGLTPDDVLPAAVLLAPEYETALTGPGAADPSEVEHFVAGLCAWARAESLRSLSALYLGPGAALLADRLAAAGFGSVPLGSANVIEVTWTDPEGYVAGLPYKHRNIARYEMRRFTESGARLRIRPLQDTEPHLVELLMLHARRHGTPQSEAGAAALLERVRETFGPDGPVLFVAESEDGPLAFALFVRCGGELVLVLTGTRYGHPHASVAHFQTMFYAPAAAAPGLGVTALVHGLGDDATKRRRGARQVPLSAAFHRF
ncbi:hypothetical protein L3i22_041630 [Actinoplanes sp. L3-i22]|nr:hypothetical protein L3i22_041630 [Actinoplanes sp. L3-i22]